MTTLAATAKALTSVPAGAAANAASVPPSAAGPVRWRLALLTLAGVYPVITAYLYVIMPLTEGWAIWQRTLILAPLMVLSIVYVIAPRIQRHFGWFLRPAAGR